MSTKNKNSVFIRYIDGTSEQIDFEFLTNSEKHNQIVFVYFESGNRYEKVINNTCIKNMLVTYNDEENSNEI